MNDPDAMKAISASRIRAALRGASIDQALEAYEKVGDYEAFIATVTESVMAIAVEIQRPDTVLKSEYDLVVAKNQTLVQLMDLMTAQLNAKSNSNPAKETERRVGVRIRQADGSERHL